MSIKAWDRIAAAQMLEERTELHLANIALPPPQLYFRQIRSYLQRITDTDQTTNGAHLLSQRTLDNGDTQIDAGPTIFREPCEDCIQFRSGAKLSFGITLRVNGARTTLLSYRFHLALLPTSGLQFIRIDLNAPKDAYDPLHMPRCHMHPGFENILLPFPVMSPLAVLDRIMHVIEPRFTR